MESLTLLLAGSLSGLVAGMAGLGGGTVIVPVLTWLYGAGALHEAIVVSWFAVLFNSLSAAIKHYHLRTSEERTEIFAASRYFLMGVLAVTPLVALLMSGASQIASPMVVGTLQLSLAGVLLWPMTDGGIARGMRKSVDALCGGIVGGASTLIGIGGGAYTIAYMVYGPRRSLRDAIAAGNVTGVAVGALSVAGYGVSLLMAREHGLENRPTLISPQGMAVLIVGGVVFSALGVKLSRTIPTSTLRKILVGLLAVSAVRLLIQ